MLTSHDGKNLKMLTSLPPLYGGLYLLLGALKKDDSIIITKVDKGNCFVVMDRPDYDEKMQALLDDITTYEIVKKNPFGRVKRELNSKLLSLKKEGKLDDRTYNRLHSTDGLPPTICGSVKHHKGGYLLRPIINGIGSSLYNTSKYLTTILSPIAREIKNIKIDDDEVMVSFDVVSLFTCQYIRTKLEQDDTLTSHTNLTIDDIISLLDFTLSNNYFIYNNVTYKQIYGCAMGSPVSPIVANLCMEVIENTAIHTTLANLKHGNALLTTVSQSLKRLLF